MKSFNNLNINVKLLVSCLLIGLVPFTILALISIYKASDSLSTQTYQQLEAVRSIKARQIETFLDRTRRDTISLASIVKTFLETDTLNQALTTNSSGNQSPLSVYLENHHY